MQLHHHKILCTSDLAGSVDLAKSFSTKAMNMATPCWPAYPLHSKLLFLRTARRIWKVSPWE